MKKKFTLVLMLLSATLFAQEALKSLEEDYYDYLSLIGITERPSLSYRTLSDSIWNFNDDSDVEFAHPWQNNNLGTKFNILQIDSLPDNFFFNGINSSVNVKAFGPEVFNSYNTVNPYGQNDGGLWQGAGYNAAITGGIHIDGFGLELNLKPQFSYTQNKAFDFLRGVCGSEYSYFTNMGIDLVQRYGDKAFTNFDWGDSEVRLNYYTFTIGYGTSNPWIGPAYLNPMLGSNNAGGYPKLDLGFRKTSLYIPFTDFYFGDFEARAINGKLTESDYFDKNDINDERMLNSLFVSFAPSFIPGLTVGANRVILTAWDKHNLKYLIRLITFSTDNDVHGPGEDQKISIFFDYLFPQVGFEVYGEYGMDDFTSDISSNPFHTGIYTFGFKQDIPLWAAAKAKNIRSELIFEYNKFEMSQDFQIQWKYGGYYCHGQIRQGYTQKGQILGAGSGYFGNSQYIAYNLYYPKGKSTFFIHRSNPDNNYIYNMSVGSSSAGYGSELFQQYYAAFVTYFDFGLSTSYFVTDSLILSGSVVYDYIHNWKYITGNDIQNNIHLEFNIKYNF